MNEFPREAISSCLGCKMARCEEACPIHNPIPQIIALLKEGKEEEAADLLHSSNPFPELTSSLCDFDRQCRGRCIRGIRATSVDVPSIEKYLSRYPRPYRMARIRKPKVALVGAGIANLTIAYLLIQKGYSVDVFESLDQIGGAIYSGIPRFRFPLGPMKAIQEELQSVGVRFFFHKTIDQDSLNILRKDYSFVVLGVGAQKENMAGLTPSLGIYGGLAFLREINLSKGKTKEFHNPVIWGGGNVAMDCARTALKEYGKATVIYRRGKEEMPASQQEIEEAILEGVEIRFLENIVQTKTENGKLEGVFLTKMEYGPLDSSARRSVIEVPNSTSFFPCDLLIAALGEKPDLSSFGLTSSNPDDLRKERIYLVGDARYGAKTIASAIADGKEIARQIEEDETNSTPVLSSF